MRWYGEWMNEWMSKNTHIYPISSFIRLYLTCLLNFPTLALPHYIPISVQDSPLPPNDLGLKKPEVIFGFSFAFSLRKSLNLHWPVLTSFAAANLPLPFYSQCQILVEALITSCLDHCNIFLTSFLGCRLSPLQIIHIDAVSLFLKHPMHTNSLFWSFLNLSPKCKCFLNVKILLHLNYLWGVPDGSQVTNKIYLLTLWKEWYENNKVCFMTFILQLALSTLQMTEISMSMSDLGIQKPSQHFSFLSEN